MKLPAYLKGGLILIAIILFISLISVSESIGLWIVVGFFSIVGLFLFSSLVFQLREAFSKPSHRLYVRDFYLKLMSTLMGFFFVLGTLLYLYVFYTISHDAILSEELKHEVHFSDAEYILRAIICSLDLFMLDVDTNTLDRLDQNSILKGWLSIQAVLSFSCTVAMLVGLIFSRLKAYYRLNYLVKINNNKNHLYLFFGNNEPSELLIKDIMKHDPKAITIIIDESNVNEDDNNEWEGIVNLITHKPKVIDLAEKIGAHVAIANQQLDDIEDEISAREDFDAFGYLGLSKIKKLISRLSQTKDPSLHIFFMGEDEELNIRNIITLAKDKTILSVAQDKSIYHRIYCHARYNGPNRVIQDVAVKKHLNIKLVDSSHIAIELLKFDSSCHPVNVVKTSSESPTTVETPLKTLIVGFGEVGRDAFRFLYEFGTFVDSKDHNKRSKFDCTIVDNNINNLKGTLMSTMPGIFGKDAKNDDVSIKFRKTDYNSQLFNTIILDDDFLSNVNYIIISIGNNDEAIALAARIFNRARKLRTDISDLRIFVRCTDNNKVEGIQKIADHYNYGYGNGENNTPVIKIFGQPEKTYTYDLVISDRLIEEGKLFHEKYRILSGEGKSWEERHNQLTDTGIPDIEKLRKLRRQESQDRANALHAATKIILLKKALTQLPAGAKSAEVDSPGDESVVDWKTFYCNYFNADGSANVSGSKENISYPGLTEHQNKIILNLAILEHLRWNSAHLLMGYVFTKDGTGCDERTMQHNCLCSWDELDSQSDKIKDWPCDYKKYDFCVVDTTISLNKPHLLNEKLSK